MEKLESNELVSTDSESVEESTTKKYMTMEDFQEQLNYMMDHGVKEIIEDEYNDLEKKFNKLVEEHDKLQKKSRNLEREISALIDCIQIIYSFWVGL